VYLAPIVAGGILVLFMVKPLFARPSVDTRIRSLTPQSDPLLFAFVARVCEAVGAPAPRRIDADFQVNASASFRRGMLSMLGNDLVLTIGLPLAAGLDLRQFAGVLAHEFGHFTQGAGMRLTYFIRAISMWFTRVVYQRDQWDERLEAWARGLDIRVSFILHLARLCVWITRRILWVLMVVGHAVSGFMLRQMELDADRHQVRLVGSDAFEPTFRKITLLDVATEGAHMDLGEWYKEGRLGDNLPRLIVANLEQIPEELVDKILAGEARRKTGWFDSHPASKDRLANALREAAPGVFHLEIPAATLFSDFEGLCRNVTWDFYRGVFGPQFQPSDMHPVADLLSRQGRQVAAVKALARYFQGQFNVLRPITLPPEAADPPENAAQASEQMKAARAKMLALTADYEKALEDYDKSDTLAIECLQAAAAAQAKVTVPAGTFSRPLGTPAALRRGQDVVFAEQKRLKPQLRAFEQAAEERLASALRLLAVPQVAARVADAPRRREEVVRLLPAVRALARHLSGILGVRDTRAVLSILLASIQGNQQSVSLFGALDRNGSDLHTRLTRLRHELQCEPYPFDHAKGDLSIAQYALADEPRSDDLGANYQGAEEMLDKLATLYRRAMAELAQVAEQVESAFGLEPLPEVEKTQIGTEP
jgi:tetratricopeptide (TPR) repeat protein